MGPAVNCHLKISLSTEKEDGFNLEVFWEEVLYYRRRNKPTPLSGCSCADLFTLGNCYPRGAATVAAGLSSGCRWPSGAAGRPRWRRGSARSGTAPSLRGGMRSGPLHPPGTAWGPSPSLQDHPMDPPPSPPNLHTTPGPAHGSPSTDLSISIPSPAAQGPLQRVGGHPGPG